MALLFAIHGPARAAVEVAFYSREMGGGSFPHAFVTLRGTVDATGEAVDTNLGFSASTITPAILLGSVTGEVLVGGERQIARSDRHFAITLTDAQYAAVTAVVERWRTRRQPSYNLSGRNCIHFVAEIAKVVALRIDYPGELMRQPRSYLQHVRTLNPQLESTAVRPPIVAPAEAPNTPS